MWKISSNQLNELFGITHSKDDFGEASLAFPPSAT